MWLYNKKVLNEAPSGFYGFVYCITDDKKRRYYGKKAFFHNKKRKKRGRRTVKFQVNSGWVDYVGSCVPLLEYLAQGGKISKKEIIKLCEDKKSLTYWESHYLFTKGVLFDENCWNGNIMNRFFKGKIHK